MDLHRCNEEHRNYGTIGLGLAFIGEKLEGYTKDKLDITYKAIYIKLSGKPPCRQQCSKVHKNKVIKWCQTCDQWRTELNKTRSRQQGAWSGMTSSKWPENYENIAEVYLPDKWDNRDFKDVGTQCHIWTNLKTCNINKITIKRLRKVRNTYAHNPQQRSSDRDKLEAFDVFKDLLHDRDLQGHIDIPKCIDELSKLKGQNDRQLANIEKTLMEIRKNQEGANLYQNMLKSLTEGIVRTGRTKYVVGCFILSAVILLWFLFVPLFPTRGTPRRAECLSEDYRYPFGQDMPLLGYFSEHHEFVGRDWLFAEIRDRLFNSVDYRKNIIVFVAGMGYGKSAIIAHMLCPRPDSPAFILKKHVVGFHICKFDVRSTHAPERFIRRLVGFLALRSAEYGQIISSLGPNSILYSLDECAKDYLACFDQGVINPLKQLNVSENLPWIILIDALDECESSGNINNILQLLLSRVNDFPTFLKFLVTSRNSSSLTSHTRLKVNYLLANDTRHIDDIENYISQHISNRNRVRELAHYSDGNFVYVVQAIKWLIANGNSDPIPKLPVDLEDVYEINFDRIYEDNKSYKIPRTILEIVCSAVNPIGKLYIYNILHKNNITRNMTEFDHHFHSLSFVLNVDETVRLTHQALFHWLVNQKKSKYRISLETGHSLIFFYLFSTTNTWSPVDLVNLAINVTNSNEPNLVKLFQSANFSSDIVEKNSLLHRLVWKTPSVHALKLLSEHSKSIDTLNEGSVTPIFVAATKGHIAQVELLDKMGADINFQVKSDVVILGMDVESKIDLIKHVHLSGYTLLHIACQNGHSDVAKYLIQQNETLLFIENSLGLHPGLVACETGLLDVIKYSFNKYPKSFEDECLHYASKNNHLEVVKWLVSKGVVYQCVSEESSISAYNAITDINPNQLHNLSLVSLTNEPMSSNFIRPLDKWWQVLKFDPVMTGIRQGSIKTTEYLIKTFPQSLKCSDSFGFTAALAVVAFTRSELLPFVKENLITDNCRPASKIYTFEWYYTYINHTLQNVCPENGSVAHVLAIYYSSYIFNYIVQNDLVTDWNKANKFGDLPVHYAVTNYQTEFLYQYQNLGQSFENATDFNEVTIYHIAAQNGLLAFLYSSVNNLLKQIPDTKTKHGMRPLHYLLSEKAGKFKTHERISRLFVHLITDQGHKLRPCDHFGNNVLHYALKNGHFKIVEYLYSSKRSSVLKMLSQKNHNGFKPVEYAIKMNVNSPLLSASCFYSGRFFFIEDATCMSDWEFALLSVVKQMSERDFNEYLQPHLSYVWHNNLNLFKAIIIHHSEYLDKVLVRSLLLEKTNSNFLKFNQLLLAFTMPTVFDYCVSANMTPDSPILYLVRNFDHENTLFSLTNEYHSAFYNIFANIKFLSNCVDKYGYGIVYHAVKSGNIKTAIFLVEHGIEVTSAATDIKGIFLAALTARRREAEGNFVGCHPDNTDQTSCTDVFLATILKLNFRSLHYADFCTNGVSGLSLIHILSANGMLQTLKILVEEFSPRILECRNLHGFTPLYLAQIFHMEKVVSFTTNKTAMSLPKWHAEDFFITSLLHDFPLENYSLCLQTRAKFGRRHLGHWYFCSTVILHQLSLSNHYNLRKLANILTEVLKTYYGLVSCNEYFDYHSRIRSLADCVMFVKHCFRCYVNVVSLRKSFRDLFVSKMIGEFQLIFQTDLNNLERITELLMKQLTTASDKDSCAYFRNNAFDILHMSTFNTLYYGQRIIGKIVIYYYLQFKKSHIIHIPYEYNFLRSRTTEHRLSVSGKSELPHIFVLNVHNFHYLKILRKTLVYREFRDILTNTQDPTAVDLYVPHTQTVVVEVIKVNDPFADLH